MLLLHRLDALVHVAARLQQLLVRLLDLVLLESHLRLRQIEAVLQRGLVGIARPCELRRQLLDGVAIAPRLFCSSSRCCWMRAASGDSCGGCVSR